MHKRISEIYKSVSNTYRNIENVEGLLKDLGDMDVTRTEAWIVLHKCYKVDEDLADKLVLEFNFWKPESYQDTMYQMALYLKDDIS